MKQVLWVYARGQRQHRIDNNTVVVRKFEAYNGTSTAGLGEMTSMHDVGHERRHLLPDIFLLSNSNVITSPCNIRLQHPPPYLPHKQGHRFSSRRAPSLDGSSLKKAFKSMHNHSVPGSPVSSLMGTCHLPPDACSTTVRGAWQRWRSGGSASAPQL